MRITKHANAKINLSLDLTSVLPNGYHAIHTVMQSVTLHDTVHVTTGEPGIRLTCDAPGVPADGRNTAYTAAERFFAAVHKAPDVEIEIIKRIPSQAGLGGGSADAAAVLRILNEMHGVALREEALLEIGAAVGADVPFALTGGTRYCQNIGEVTAPLPHAEAHVVIAKPAAGVSTAEAFCRFDSGAALTHPDNDRLLFHFAAGRPKEALMCANNVFEQLVTVPEGERIKRILRDHGAYYASLSGSGSAYYGLFDAPEAAEAAKDALQAIVPFACCCKTARQGVENE